MRRAGVAPLVCLASWLAGAPVRAGPAAGEVVVVVEGLDAGALAEALALRVPGARVVESPRGPCAAGDGSCADESVEDDAEDMSCETECVIARIVRGPDGSVQVEVRGGEARVFRRTLTAEIAEAERAAATSLSHLLAAIAEGTAEPEPEPEVAGEPEEVAPAAKVVMTPPVVSAAPAPAMRETPRFEVGPIVGLTAAVGAGRPTALAGWVGSGGLVGVELRGRSGLLGDCELRGLGMRDGGLRLGRLRAALAIGYSLRRGLFELRTRAAVTIEPWWVRRTGGPAHVGAPLLGGAVSLTPGLSAPLSPRVRLDVGLRVEAAVSVEPSRAAVVQAVDADAMPRFRLGGVELAASAQIGVRWGR